MRYRLLSILLILVLSSCTFDVKIVTPPPSPTFLPTSFPDPNVALPTDIASPLPPPAYTPIITPTPLQASSSGVYPIRFAPDGTYVDVIDSIAVGTSKTYSINAMQGQVMSISVHQNTAEEWTVTPLKITGADGTTLCPQKENTSCYFWHGVLPATQDYFVTLTPFIDIHDFTLRVAIDPPGKATQAFLFENQYRQASFTYTDEFAPIRFPEMYITRITPDVALQFIDTKSIVNTNLIEAYFLFGSSREADIVPVCTQPVSFGGEENIVGDVTINGVTFTKSQGGGVGAGNAYLQTYYRAAHNGTCYEITFFVHYANIGNYAPDSGIKEYDDAALTQKFESILSTLVLK